MNGSPFPAPRAQLAQLLRGTAECVREEDLLRRLEQSHRSRTPLKVKLGFDPTAPDLHLGHAVQLRKLRQFQDLGHQALLVVGGATAMLGDPSGKDKMRPQLTRDEVQANAGTYLAQATKVLREDRLTVVDNADWFLGFRFEQLLKLCSRMTVARMIERDLFARRLQQGTPIGIHEFLYPLLQGWDSVEIHSDVELGGTDQLFNLLVGRDLQEQEGQTPQVCLTMPLLLGLDGHQKMSKSLGNYVGLDFAAEDIYGKIMSIPDEQMRSYFVLLTDLDDEVIEERLAGHPRDAKAALAHELVVGLHDEGAARQAAAHFDRVFRARQVPEDVPRLELPAGEVADGSLWVVELVVRVGFARSNGEARRLIQGRGIRINGEVVEDVDLQVPLQEEVLVQAGKRRFARVSVRR